MFKNRLLHVRVIMRIRTINLAPAGLQPEDAEVKVPVFGHRLRGGIFDGSSPGVSLRFTALNPRRLFLTPPASANAPYLGRWANSDGTFLWFFFAGGEKAAGLRRGPRRFARTNGGKDR